MPYSRFIDAERFLSLPSSGDTFDLWAVAAVVKPEGYGAIATQLVMIGGASVVVALGQDIVLELWKRALKARDDRAYGPERVEKCAGYIHFMPCEHFPNVSPASEAGATG